jgi:hypothetical protein
MTVCKECGCDKVQTIMWVEVNTAEVHDLAFSQGEDYQDNWCPNCDSNCELADVDDKPKTNTKILLLI